jgi:hypothetical protein
MGLLGWDPIGDFFRKMMIEAILNNVEAIFNDFNGKIGDIAGRLSQGPEMFNKEIYDIILFIAEDVVMPVAGMIVTFVAVYELIQMVISKNSFHDIETFMFFKWAFKTVIAIYLITNALTLIDGFFAIAGDLINSVSETPVDVPDILAISEGDLNLMSTGKLFVLMIETLLMRFAIVVMTGAVIFILYGRMIEIYVMMSVAPLPVAAVLNRDWAHMGTSYFKTMFAFAMQGLFMMIIVKIYVVLAKDSTGILIDSGGIDVQIISLAVLTFILVIFLFRSGSIAKAIFN